MLAGFRKGGVPAVLGLCVVLGLAGCTGGAPPNDVAQGVGFSDLQAFEARRAMLRGEAAVRVPETVISPLAPVSAALPPAGAGAMPVAAPAPVIVTAAAQPESIAAATMAALRDSPAAPVAPAPAPVAPEPVVPASALPGNPDISDEQDFDAVAIRETIESDAERRARMQAERVVVAPSALPERPEGLGPNIVDYALATNHGLGERRYTRRPISAERHERACRAFRSGDLAQEWFLQNGGPGRDRQGLDPDGDGYACGWDPSIFRSAAAAARN